MGEPVQLTELQLDIMRVLWTRGEATVAEICRALESERSLALTTVATLLSRLEKRGVVEHETRARQFVYRAVVTEAEARHSMVHELTERLFDGNVADLLTHLVTERQISAGDLERLKALLDQRTQSRREQRHES